VSIIHRTTLTPTKLELLSAWLPSRPWYRGLGTNPELVKAGGFRLDDPADEVGIEFMVARHDDGAQATAYHVPMTYRNDPLAGAEDALIGTTEHGVLGRRWVYDATRDPVFAAQVAALLRGNAEPQAQSISDTPDPTVHVEPLPGADEAPAGFTAADDARGTAVLIDANTGALTVRVHRILLPATVPAPRPGQVTGRWQLPGNAEARGVFLATDRS
jgi:Maltokinase N-terminal cap domain